MMRAAMIAGALGAALAPEAATAATYAITALPSLGGAIYPNAINNSGQVVGSSYVGGSFTEHAFLYANGGVTDLTPGAIDGDAQDINSSGQVTGRTISVGTDGAFVYSNGATTYIGTLNNGLPNNVSEAYGINDAGQVSGASFPGPATSQHAFVYGNGQFTNLGTLGGGFNGGESFGYDINNAGQITGYSTIPGGYRGILYSGGVLQGLGTLGGRDSFGRAINDLGQIVGESTIAGDLYNRAFLYQNGAMTSLGTLGGGNSYASELNNFGQIVGFSEFAPGIRDQHAFLYDKGTMQDLNGLIDPALGWVLNNATAINDVGQIVGYGLHNGVEGAFLLDKAAAPPPPPPPPASVPEPASWAMFIAGFGLVGTGLRRRRGLMAPA